MPKGCVLMKNGSIEYTRYSSCCNTDRQEYYYQTYDNFTVRSVRLGDKDLNDKNLGIYKIE